MRRTYLLGAGFTYDLGMPLAAEVTSTFLRLVTPEGARKLADALARQNPYSKGREIAPDSVREGFELLIDFKNKGGSNYEAFLAQIEQRAHRLGAKQPEMDSFHYVFSVLYDFVLRVLFAYQIASYEVLYKENAKFYRGLSMNISGDGTWIFSLNHDIYVELLALDQGIPITYGDSDHLEFPLNNHQLDKKLRLTSSTPDAFTKNNPAWFSGSRGINLVRLHGGLAEHTYKDQKTVCNLMLQSRTSAHLFAEFLALESLSYIAEGRRLPSGRDRFITGPTGDLDILRRTVLTGGRKYSKTTEEKPGEEKLKLFSDLLLETEQLHIMGYGFGDNHINNRILNAMVLNRDLKIWIVDPVFRPPPDFLQQFDYKLRIRRASCSAPLWFTFDPDQEKWDPSLSDVIRAEIATPPRKRSDVQQEVNKLFHITLDSPSA